MKNAFSILMLGTNTEYPTKNPAGNKQCCVFSQFQKLTCKVTKFHSDLDWSPLHYFFPPVNSIFKTATQLVQKNSILETFK